jgi:hypothetical protein
LRRRRWLRFSVRTLLIAVTVFCVWLGWQVSIVRERKAVMTDLDKELVESAVLNREYVSRTRNRTLPYAEVTWRQRVLGDELHATVLLLDAGRHRYEDVAKLFPEADVVILTL